MLMIHGGFRHLPVVEEGKVVGILSIRDLMRGGPARRRAARRLERRALSTLALPRGHLARLDRSR